MSWSLADGVGVVRAEDVDDPPGFRIYLAPLPHGPIRVVAGSGAAIIAAALVAADLEEVCDNVARSLGLAAQEVEQHAVRDFLADLVELGLLVQS